MGERLAAAQSLDDFQHFFQPRHPRALVYTGVAPLGLLHRVERASHANSELQPATGNQVNRAHHLSQQHGMSQGH